MTDTPNSVIPFHRKLHPHDDGSRVALLKCRACKLHWYAIYDQGVHTTEELPCPDCDAVAAEHLNASRLVVFYEHDGGYDD